MIDPAIVLLLCACAAALFGSAALHKFAALREFRTALLAYDILPRRMVGAASYILPGCELLVAVGVCIEAFRSRAITAAAVFLFAYTLAIGVNLWRGRRYIDCGCARFGGRLPIASWMLLRNLALVLLLATFNFLPWSARPLQWIDAVTVAAGLASIAFLYLAAEELLGSTPRAMNIAGVVK